MRRAVLLLVVLLGFGVAVGAIPAPVAHFGFDVYDGKISDSVSGQSLAVPSAVSVKSDGISGSYVALKRQGDSVISLGKNFGFTGDFSISFWVRTSPGYRDSGSIALGRHLAGSYNGYFFMINGEWGYGATDKITFYYSNASAISKTSINDGRWHHVAAVYRKTQGATLYIDGALDAKGPANPIIIPDVPFVVGGITWDKPNGTFAGDIDELAIFDKAVESIDIGVLAKNPGYFKAQSKGFYGNENIPSAGGTTPGSQPGGVPGGPSGGMPGSIPGGASTGVSGGVNSGAVMRIILKSGQVISLSSSDIARIEFGP